MELSAGVEYAEALQTEKERYEDLAGGICAIRNDQRFRLRDRAQRVGMLFWIYSAFFSAMIPVYGLALNKVFKDPGGGVAPAVQQFFC